MPLIKVELDAFLAALGRMAAENQAMLAACAGHQFKPVNAAIPRGNHVCVVCRGVAAYVDGMETR